LKNEENFSQGKSAGKSNVSNCENNIGAQVESGPSVIVLHPAHENINNRKGYYTKEGRKEVVGYETAYWVRLTLSSVGMFPNESRPSEITDLTSLADKNV